MTGIFCSAMLGASPVYQIAGQGMTAVAGGVPLIARMTEPKQIGAMYGAFLILPAALALLVLGSVTFLRLAALVVRVLRGDVEESLPSWRHFAGLLGCLAVYAGFPGAVGTWAMAAATLVCCLGAGPLVARRGAGVSVWLLALAALSLGGLAHYQFQLATGAEPSRAIAPTLFLAGFALGSAGLVLGIASRLFRSVHVGNTAITSALCFALWYMTPLARWSGLAVVGDSAEVLMSASTALAMATFAMVLARDRREPAGAAALPPSDTL